MTGLEIFMPGRLCLFGEHSDWAGGYRRSDLSIEPGECLIVGTDQGLHATASAAEGRFALRQVAASGAPGRLETYPADPGCLRRVASSGAFDSYAAGAAALVLERFPGLGLSLDIHRRTLPLRKGLSSSAAICVLVTRAFNLVHGLGLSVRDEMELAYKGELLTGSSCGRMDQACAFGSVPVVLGFDGDSMGIREIASARVLPLLVVDLGTGKDTRRILAELNAAFAAGEPGIRRALGMENRRILRSAEQAMVEGEVEVLGTLMTEAQQVFDTLVAPSCPSELGAPRLHAVLAHPATRRLAFGGKGVGSQGDGSAQLVCRSLEARCELATILEREMCMACMDLTIRPSQERHHAVSPGVT